jgi:hypothetical protein
MSKARAKKKQRRRARTADGRPAPAPPAPAVARVGAAGAPGPARSEIRDGVRRPDAIWAPFPLTEIGMAVGLVLFLIGFAGAAAIMVAGVLVLFVVVAELCLREHFAGFRSHSLLLGFLPVTAAHVALVVAGGLTLRGPVALAVDVALGGGLAWWLRRRFAMAQATAQELEDRVSARRAS